MSTLVEQAAALKVGDVVEVTWRDHRGEWVETSDLWDIFGDGRSLGINAGTEQRAIRWPDGSVTGNVVALRVVA